MFPLGLPSRLPSAQNNTHAKVAHLEGACSEPLQGIPHAQFPLLEASSILYSHNALFLVDCQMCWLKVSNIFHAFILFKQKTLKNTNI